MMLSVNVDDLNFAILQQDTRNHNTFARQSNPNHVDITEAQYLQDLIARWFNGRRDEIIERQSRVFTEQYRNDANFRQEFDAFIAGRQ